MLVKNYSLLGLHWGLYLQHEPAVARDAHAQLLTMAADGRIKPFVSQEVPFRDAPTALARVAAGESSGRIVVQSA